MPFAIIGELEVTYEPGAEPALVFHHLVRGHDVARLDAGAAAELRELLAVSQKRIRELGGYRALFGASGDLALYGPAGQRACYLTADQALALGRLLGGPSAS